MTSGRFVLLFVSFPLSSVLRCSTGTRCFWCAVSAENGWRVQETSPEVESKASQGQQRRQLRFTASTGSVRASEAAGASQRFGVEDLCGWCVKMWRNAFKECVADVVVVVVARSDAPHAAASHSEEFATATATAVAAVRLLLLLEPVPDNPCAEEAPWHRPLHARGNHRCVFCD